MIKLLSAVLLAGAVSTLAYAATVVVPNANTSVLGGDNSGSLPTTPASGEFQGVFASSQFPAGPINITGLNWRAIPGPTGAVHATVSGTVTFAYSQNPPNLLSTTFSHNDVGIGDTLVLTASGLAVNDPGCVAGPTPCAFGTNFVFTTPFNYNPAVGPLLVDIKFTSLVSTGTGQWDVADCTGTCVSDNIFATPLGAATGFDNTSNNVTQFVYTTIAPTPIPPSILITLLGLACVGFYVGRRGLKFA